MLLNFPFTHPHLNQVLITFLREICINFLTQLEQFIVRDTKTSRKFPVWRLRTYSKQRCISI